MVRVNYIFTDIFVLSKKIAYYTDTQIEIHKCKLVVSQCAPTLGHTGTKRKKSFIFRVA